MPANTKPLRINALDERCFWVTLALVNNADNDGEHKNAKRYCQFVGILSRNQRDVLSVGCRNTPLCYSYVQTETTILEYPDGYRGKAIVSATGLHMMLTKRIKKLVVRPINRFLKRPVKRVEGLPDDLEVADLECHCRELTGSPLKQMSYTHLSGWKRAGASRIFLQNRRGEEVSLIYKNAIYTHDHIPALKGFPATPGYPEYLIYSQSEGALQEYLPHVYLCREKQKESHYQYLLEDLGRDYVSISEKTNRREKIDVVAAMPGFHEAMKAFTSQSDTHGFLRYDYHFSVLLLAYAKKTLSDFKQLSPSFVVCQVSEMWDELSSLMLNAECRALDRCSLVHGDANGANLLVGKNNPTKLKILDWEWAGLGMALADVASLFRRADDATTERILSVYRRNSPGTLSQETVRRQFARCRLERCLMDAAYVAAQHMGTSDVVKKNQSWAPRFVEQSLSTMMGSYHLLEH